jgi:hypothetical protein
MHVVGTPMPQELYTDHYCLRIMTGNNASWNCTKRTYILSMPAIFD